MNSTISALKFIAEDENELVIGRKKEVLLIRVDNFDIANIVRSVATVEHNKPDNRFNEARADSRGRLWAGLCVGGHFYLLIRFVRLHIHYYMA